MCPAIKAEIIGVAVGEIQHAPIAGAAIDRCDAQRMRSGAVY